MFWCQFLDDTFTHKACCEPTLSNCLNTKELKSHPHSHAFLTQMFVHVMLEEKALNPPLWVIQEQSSKAVQHAFLF